MTKYANIDYSVEIYKLSKWETDRVWSLVAKDWEQEMIIQSINSTKNPDGSWLVEEPLEIDKDYKPCYKMGQKYLAPCYDAEFLMEKLPFEIPGAHLVAGKGVKPHWWFGYKYWDEKSKERYLFWEWAHEPENALAKLTIALFKHGYLKKETSDAHEQKAISQDL